MLALAQFCQIHSLSFQYYTRPVPNWLKQSPIGNLAGALDYKMQWRISETGQPPEIIDNNYLLVPQGITMPGAELGIRKLALEIEDYCKNKIIPDAAIVLPSGTGATALYLQQHLKQTVHTIPCIGNEQVLQQFFKQQLPNAERYPSILNSAERDLPFGKPHPDLLSIYIELRESTGIEFELLYDAKAWLYLTKWECDKPIIYIHNGGISGNSSMLSRYRRLGLWND